MKIQIVFLIASLSDCISLLTHIWQDAEREKASERDKERALCITMAGANSSNWYGSGPPWSSTKLMAASEDAREEKSIHQSIFLTVYPTRVLGELEPILAEICREVGYTLDWLPIHHRKGKVLHLKRAFCVTFNCSMARGSLFNSCHTYSPKFQASFNLNYLFSANLIKQIS